MENKKPSHESYIVKEAEHIIDDYLKRKEMCNIKNYYNLKEKYERLRILTISLFITSCIGVLLSFIIK